MARFTETKEYKKLQKIYFGKRLDSKLIKKLLKLSYKNINYKFCFVNSFGYDENFVKLPEYDIEQIYNRHIEIIKSKEDVDLATDALINLVRLLGLNIKSASRVDISHLNKNALDSITDNLSSANPQRKKLIEVIKFEFGNPKDCEILNNYERIEEIVDHFSDFAFDLDNGDARNTAVGFLVNLKNPEGQSTFEKLISDENAYVKTNARIGLEFLKKKEFQNKIVDKNKINWEQGNFILKFPFSHSNQYSNHIKFIRELKKNNLFPDLNVFVFEAVDPFPLNEIKYIIVISGEMDEAKKFDKLYFSPEVEKVFNKLFGNVDRNWSSISPPATLSNLPYEGYRLDLSSFNEFASRINQNEYKLIEKL